jgi:uncharacterized phage protein (TIGR02220 family)
MPRIRTLKPEHRQHRKVGPLDHVTYRLWVGMILEADDEGRLVYDPEALRVLIFGFHGKVSRVLVEASTTTLARLGLVNIYRSEGQDYVCFPSWHDHQKIDRPRPSLLPSCDASTSIRRTFDDHSSLIYPDLIGSDRKGSRSDQIGERSTNARRPLDTHAQLILDFLNHKAGRNYRPTPINLGFIRARLQAGATVDQCRAIIGRKTALWKSDPKMNQFLRPATLFNETKFEQYLGELPATAFQEDPDA